ncbi:MAG: aspartate kinase [Lentisphaerae bacterium]|nr:aspartate kinase [Lentisphaerota bacterium]
MGLIVQKFGGSSLADPACLRRVAARVLETRRAGHDVVVVVSAMGDTTDALIELAHQVNSSPSDREMDMLMSTGEQVSVAVLSMALHVMGVEAVSLTGAQAGIRTDAAHRKAKILRVNPARIRRHLREGRIVIVAGFQGLTPLDDIATLGRGGSDTTAVALAAALRAERCQIFTDVEGVYSADPRVVPDARKLKEIAYDEMLELASLGARVLMSRSVEFAKKYGVRIEVLSSFVKAPGTLVKEEVADMEDIIVRGISADQDQVKLTIGHVPDRPGMAARIFRELAAANINIDMIVQNTSEQGITDISFTIHRDDQPRAREVLEKAARSLKVRHVNVDQDIAKVSVVGVGMRGHSGVAYRVFHALAENNINILMIATSEIKISVVVRKKLADKAMRVLHETFSLHKAPRRPAVKKGARNARKKS